jgi:putative Ca2+/H+ antiporter (TMEM165/GDT1 family)
MFSTGQWVFAALFLIFFIWVLIRAYSRDKKLHARNYKGVLWVGIVFVVFVILLFFIKYMLRK